MAIPATAYLPDSQLDEFKKTVLTRLTHGMTWWRPLHVRQDYWSMMYHLQDLVQKIKPYGYRQFISNEPRTAVDLAQNILTRNNPFWRIALFETTNEAKEERKLIGKIERVLQGIIYDVDELFSMRLRQPFWSQVAHSALLRGYVWGKVHVTTEALKFRETPIMAEVYDPRLVYPHVDSFGLAYVIVQSQTTMGDLVSSYPDVYGDRELAPDYDPNRPAVKIEYWSNDRGDRKGVNAVLASEAPVETSMAWDISAGGLVGGGMAPRWVVKPYFHGYTPNALPIVGVAVNGSNLTVRPQLGDMVTGRMQEIQSILGNAPTAYSWWNGNNTWVADTGRSILSSVEEHVPQFNELVATCFQHLAMNTWPTLVFTTPTGQLPKFHEGINAKIPLTPEEKVERLQTVPMNPDAFKLIELLEGERQNGMLANILRANSQFTGNGVLFQQMANAALNALEPFSNGMEEFGQRIGTSLLAQLQMAAPAIKEFTVLAPSSAQASRRQSYWTVDFDPKKDLDKKKRYRPRPVFKPSLPDDLAVRINAARLALDPKRPILSLTTVLEHILEVEDPTDEIDRIWEDIANTDPVIVFTQIAEALRSMGENELADRIEEKQFRQSFTEELAFRQQTGGAIPAPGQPGNMPPEAGAGQFNSFTAEDQGMSGGGGASSGQPGLPTGDQTSV